MTRGFRSVNLTPTTPVYVNNSNEFVIGEANPALLIIPIGVFHGFTSATDEAAFIVDNLTRNDKLERSEQEPCASGGHSDCRDDA